MKKSILFVGLGLSSLVAVAGLASLNRVPSNSEAIAVEASQPAVSEAIAPDTSQPTAPEQVAQANPNALAAELQGRPTVVKIYADWCAACQRLRPVTESLQQQFQGRANFVIFDVTDRATTRAAQARAEELGLSDFLDANRARTSAVAVIDPSNGQILQQFHYNFNQQDYVNAINQAISETAS
ncbi:redoxin domain-containing protein [Microcoleus sp. FACHB-1515]|uniref:thioredoxin domain-containing protein n=1 Tax=Cyanophyceae TaxID=3028117 RepID=UPI001686EF51|nr:thioredoxin domain-containing protein [Microcoleus sp. FACHB-1515]MBD2091254.1 redoxin domain-containing protein [Microcoleus sp. FACHB-1515]